MVTTHAYAYAAGSISLCQRHVAAPPYPLGAELRGPHQGVCAACHAASKWTVGDLWHPRPQDAEVGDYGRVEAVDHDANKVTVRWPDGSSRVYDATKML